MDIEQLLNRPPVFMDTHTWEEIPEQSHPVSAVFAQTYTESPLPDKTKKYQRWTQEENERLTSIVNLYKERNEILYWAQAALQFPGRSAECVRNRWVNYLNPDASPSQAFTPEEDRIIAEKHDELGNKLDQIALLLPGKSANSIKIRWNVNLSRKTSECKAYRAAWYQRKKLEKAQQQNSGQGR